MTYEQALNILVEFKYPFKEIKDLRGAPFFIVELVKPDRCPVGGAYKYYSWGLRFTADGKFFESWGKPPISIANDGAN